MELYIMLYRVTVDNEKICYGKAGVATMNINTDWPQVRKTIYQGYKKTFPKAIKIEIEPVKATKVSAKKYADFIMAASGVYN